MNTVRIISGKYKGRKITTPGGATHPMGEREKLALFNMLQPYTEGSRVLDAFAGSGALGIEALSRGAFEVEFIEKSAKAAMVIQGNLQNLSIEAKIFRGKVADFVESEKFDVVIADPPYDDFDEKEVERLAKNFLVPGGILALSHPGEAPEFREFELIKSNQYAGAHISIYRLA